MKVCRDGVRVVRLNLYPTLRVAGVYAESGAPLDFVQEDKEYDPDFAVILPAAAKAGHTVRLLTVYSGKDAVRADGNDTFYLMPGARESWYPSGKSQLGDFANFHMTFHLPKQLQIVATGKQVSLTPEGGGMVKAVWESGSPIPVAGFNLGDFKTSGAKTPQGFGVDAYADIGCRTMFAQLAESGTLGRLSDGGGAEGRSLSGQRGDPDLLGLLRQAALRPRRADGADGVQLRPELADAGVSAHLRLSGTRRMQHQLGLLDYDASYWQEVTPHEVSHQWWGNRSASTAIATSG